MRIRCLWFAVLAVALVGPGVGCDGKFKPVKVEGVVTLDGEPLPNATVRFTPEGGDGKPASGRTDETGTFKLTTFNTNDGALPGDYKVTVAIDEIRKEVNEVNRRQPNSKIRVAQASQKAGRRSKASTSSVPDHYGNPGRTPLRQRVPSQDKVLLELEGKAN